MADAEPRAEALKLLSHFLGLHDDARKGVEAAVGQLVDDALPGCSWDVPRGAAALGGAPAGKWPWRASASGRAPDSTWYLVQVSPHAMSQQALTHATQSEQAVRQCTAR